MRMSSNLRIPVHERVTEWTLTKLKFIHQSDIACFPQSRQIITIKVVASPQSASRLVLYPL